jgi:hypothetical protein
MLEIDLDTTEVIVTRDQTDLALDVDSPTVDIGIPGLRGATGHQIVFGTQGPVSVKTGTVGYYPRVPGRIIRVTAAVTNQISGTTRVDVNVTGTTVFTNQAHRPTLASTGRQFDDADTIDAPVFAATDYFTADVDTVGLGTTDLIVTVDYIEE